MHTQSNNLDDNILKHTQSTFNPSPWKSSLSVQLQTQPGVTREQNRVSSAVPVTLLIHSKLGNQKNMLAV